MEEESADFLFSSIHLSITLASIPTLFAASLMEVGSGPVVAPLVPSVALLEVFGVPLAEAPAEALTTGERPRRLILTERKFETDGRFR